MSRLVLASLTVLLPIFSSGCLQWDPLYKIPDVCAAFAGVAVTALTAPDPNDPTYPKAAIEEIGVIKVMHGFGSAQLPSGESPIKVEQGVTIPDYANQATVFLNGWRLNYLGGDENVGRLGALLTNIKLDLRTKRLTWNAAAQLQDNDGKEGYKFTYYYTVIAWNNVALNVVADHRDCAGDTDFPHNVFVSFNKGKTTALSSFSSFRQPLGIPTNHPVAVLPRGVGFAWLPDHQLLQIAYKLDNSEVFAEKDKQYIKNYRGQIFVNSHVGAPAPLPTAASLVDSGFVSWDTFAIFKDDSGRRDYAFFEVTSLLGGYDIGLVQPPFSILPKEPGVATPSPSGVKHQQFVIENIPFGIAIPVLTGWELAYAAEDEKVKDVGIWLEEWAYSPGPSGGTLRYVLGSIMGDDDNFPPHVSAHRVTVLGMRPVAGQLQKGAAGHR